ncbi:adenylate isopentenyltransferase 5, chloroplastic-like [Solanum verrucosum]|uniref:adenylate isopentenyltransferase 5, chloroplastic-like n=1 Tax=Solanum verrucosum TaxID=315347 RepID=UPI0020D112C3|nr:adenylate isopentenyltransferase 5, chloroplastic-like [Solanum verrucosum]
MGATGTGKSHLSVDLATHFRGEIINSDNMQIYKGLDIVTNKIRHTEKQGEIEPDSDFTTEDFCLQAIVYIENILKTQRVQIIVGGSISYIEKLVEDPVFIFKYKYDTCFIWIDVEQSVLNRRGDMRVDEMVNARLVDKVWQIFIPYADYTKGIQWSIGVPEMDIYLREETNIDEDDESKKTILQSSIVNIKHTKMNTFINNNKFNKKKVVFIMGATGRGKSRLSVDLATHFRGEVINSDKMQTQRVPIIVGGSNSYIEKLLEDPVFMFKYKYYTCFIWIDVKQSVLNRRVDIRVDEMVNAGLVEEVRQIYISDTYYTKGIRRSIGVPEMDRYLREETIIDEDDESMKTILQSSTANIKRNTHLLICHQLDKIQLLINEKMWLVHHIVATDVLKGDREEVVDERTRAYEEEISEVVEAGEMVMQIEE